ncbi:hypothetical protein NEF87_003467 [Candidatus Lokiarchaeum ossiferum]|uniref:Aromatic amino acid beta-eliminating lyase/threonine aldolase domain-containing protein n=1 Tax=Candidatus Lokiarchaeum ossiferum TaxID=2951803 RepID=A0ABY6HXV7_9ARCH|nr:hypothetical protein NEF87_003467 [Candidatus Lokiarchaeum sp. B-35]
MRIIDFRSDTVTKPSPEMWEVIKSMDNSKLGDDVERDDPTVLELEAKAAKVVGKDAALFVTSGTQGNLISLLAQTTPGEEILVDEQSHIYKWEVGGAARMGGLMVRTFPSNKGMFNPNNLQSLIRPHDDIHQPITSMICLENSQNYYGGIALPTSLFKETRDFADQNHLKLHVDGARIFNAAIARKIDVKEYTKFVDSVQFCLSKGLSCPIGSIIAGSHEFIDSAIKWRKMLGGGWRQAGIIASMGVVALEQKWIDRLSVDNQLAKNLGTILSGMDLPINIPEPDTNILMVEVPTHLDMPKLEHSLESAGIRTHAMGQRIRIVTHSGINQDDIEYSAQIISDVIRKSVL